jgi:hypothetical protein
MNTASEHIGELALRRHRAGEALGADGPAIAAHAGACADCRARLRALDDEQRRFEQEISFDRFSAGVERATRSATKRRRSVPMIAFVAPMLAAAAALVLVVTFKPKDASDRAVGYGNRVKGGAGIIVRVAGSEGQRTARGDAPEPLAPGERLRIGYSSAGHRYLLSLSIDGDGKVEALVPARGASLALEAGAESATRYLPEAWELTGAGLERIVVVLSDQPVDVEDARRAARAAYDKANGDLTRMPSLGLPGEEFSRLFAKP